MYRVVICAHHTKQILCPNRAFSGVKDVIFTVTGDGKFFTVGRVPHYNVK